MARHCCRALCGARARSRPRNGADILAVVTEWNEFRALNLDQAKKTMRGNVLVDLRNVFPAQLAKDAGFQYLGIGRGQAG